jgi:predicted alpha/beta superfamily hydrolase
MKVTPLILFLCICFCGYAQFPEVVLHGTQERRFTSSVIKGQEYTLQIMLPAGYSTSTDSLPVVYLMDSQWDFQLLNSLYGEQYYDGFIPKLMIVGVTWGGTNPNPDSLRARDYTPTKEGRLPQSGGADNFLNVLEKEVFPFVEANYRTLKNDRTLMGCSLGGLFTMYTLFTRPALFQRYIAATPAFGWDNEVLYKSEQKYFDMATRPPAKLFMCIGGVERSVPRFQKLTQHLNERHYSSLQIQSRVLENTGHSGTKAEGYTRGLQYVFSKPIVHPAVAVLNRYVGKYKLGDANALEIKLENGQLVLYASPTDKYLLQATSDIAFFSASEFLKINFSMQQGVVTGFEMERYTGKDFVSKVKEK